MLESIEKLVSAELPQDDTDAKLMRFENVRGQRYAEIFLIGGNAIIHEPERRDL